MEHIAIISDIHGNLEALKTVLEDIKRRKIQHIICLGDIIAKGTHQHECIELVKKHCDVVIKGNCDEFFSHDIDETDKNEIQLKRIRWNKSKLSKENEKYLQNLPFCHEFYLSGRLIRLFHATPNKIDDFVGNIDTVDRLYQIFLPSLNTISSLKADVVVYGHIHTQFLQKIFNRTIINPGSVGNSLDIYRNDEKDGDKRNTTVANYLILSGEYASHEITNTLSYEFISLPYDIEKELSENIDNIERDAYEAELRNGTYRDMLKMNHFFEVRGIDPDKI